MSVAKAGILLRPHVRGNQFPGAANPQRLLARRLNIDSRFAQLGDDGRKVLRRAGRDLDSPSGYRACHQECTRLDAIGNDTVARSAEFGNALHAQRRCSAAFDSRAHFREQVNQVGHLRLARRVFDEGFAGRQRRGHQNVLRAGDRYFFEDNVPAGQSPAARRSRRHVAVLGRNLRAHLLERLQVQIDGPRADGAPSRKRDARVAQPAHQRPQRQNRRAHGAHQFVRRFGIRNVLAPESSDR